MPLRQLSGHEAGFLYTDTQHANANVSLVHIHDQRTAPGGVVRFKQILAQIERRLDTAPLFRQRLQRVPMGLDHPYWVDDPNFDLEYHVRHIALPKPGDWRQFCIQVSRIHARGLDLDRPLWEAYVIEGLDSFLDLPPGSFALLLKTHLAAVDLGQLGALSSLLYDTDPNPPPPAPPAPWFADSPLGPLGQLGLVRTGLLSSLTAPLRLARPLLRVATSVAPAAAALASDMLLRPQNLPATRFNAIVSPHRVFDTRRFTEDEFARICALVPGATVDDAIAAVIGGALRRYLEAQGELPSTHSLAAIVPDTAGTDTDNGTTAQQWRHVRLGTDIADARQRLVTLAAQALDEPDEVARLLGSAALAEAGEQASAALLGWSRRLVGRLNARLGSSTPPANCTLAQVPAPEQALYLCGARLSYFSAILPIADGLGLAFAVTRYDGRVIISPTSCRELMPDPEAFAQCLRDSFQEYLALAPVTLRLARPAAKSAKRRGSSGGTSRRAARPG
jgi:WS/DGAT/MGAT family acyltransferase